MKKLLGLLLLVIAIAAGLFFYQRGQVSHTLKEILKGKTYSTYGLKIQIPPSEGEVQGLFKPYINVGRVILDLSELGYDDSIVLPKAVVRQKLWSRGGVVLQLAEELSPRPWLMISQAMAEMTVDEKIKSISAKQILFKSKKDELKILSPKIVWKLKATGLLDSYRLSHQGVEANFSDRNGKTQIKLGEFGTGQVNQMEGEGERLQWQWDLVHQGGEVQRIANEDSGKTKEENQAAQKKSDLDHLILGDLRIKAAGSMRKLSPEKIKEVDKAFLLGIKTFLNQLKILASGEGMASAQAGMQVFSQAFQGLIETVINVQTAYDSQMDLVTMDWQGMKALNSKSEILFSSAPLAMRQKATYQPDGSLWESEASLPRIEIKGEVMPTTVEGLSLTSRSQYKGVTSAELMEIYLNNLKRQLSWSPFFNPSFLNRVQMPDPNLLLAGLLGYVAQYPDEGEASLTVNKVAYQTKTVKGDHREMLFKLYVKPQAVGYEIKGKFDINPMQKKPDSLPLEQGETRLAMELGLPWQKLVQLAREVGKEKQVSEPLIPKINALFVDETTQFDFDFFVKLGKEPFVFNWDSFIKFPTGEALAKVKIPEQVMTADIKQLQQELSRQLLAAWAQGGELKIELGIQAFSKFQDFLTKINPGAAMGLLAIGPYAEIDSQADTLKSKLEFKDKQFLVNGKVNPELQQILAPLSDQATP